MTAAATSLRSDPFGVVFGGHRGDGSVVADVELSRLPSFTAAQAQILSRSFSVDKMAEILLALGQAQLIAQAKLSDRDERTVDPELQLMLDADTYRDQLRALDPVAHDSLEMLRGKFAAELPDAVNRTRYRNAHLLVVALYTREHLELQKENRKFIYDCGWRWRMLVRLCCTPASQRVLQDEYLATVATVRMSGPYGSSDIDAHLARVLGLPREETARRLQAVTPRRPAGWPLS